jgi:hypothetical protein
VQRPQPYERIAFGMVLVIQYQRHEKANPS